MVSYRTIVTSTHSRSRSEISNVRSKSNLKSDRLRSGRRWIQGTELLRNRATKKWSHGRSPCRLRRQSRERESKSDLRNVSRKDRRAVMLDAQRCFVQASRAASNGGLLTRCTLSIFSRLRRVSALSEMFSFSDARRFRRTHLFIRGQFRFFELVIVRCTEQGAQR